MFKSLWFKTNHTGSQQDKSKDHTVINGSGKRNDAELVHKLTLKFFLNVLLGSPFECSEFVSSQFMYRHIYSNGSQAGPWIVSRAH